MAREWPSVGLAVGLVAGMAHAGDPREMCIEASTQGQTLRNEGRLVEASEMLQRCGEPDCPSVVRSHCTTWLAEVEARIPSIWVDVPEGEGWGDVSVWLDGQPVPRAPKDGSWRLNPGEHVLVVERGSPRQRVEEKFWASEREKGRLVQLHWPVEQEAATGATGPTQGSAPRAPAMPDVSLVPSTPVSRDRYTVPVGVWVFGGVGLAALGSFTYFGISAFQRVNDMRNSCAPNCSSGQVDGARTQALVADLSLGVGVASLAGAAVWWILSGHVRPNEKAAVSADVYPVVGQGMSAALTGRF